MCEIVPVFYRIHQDGRLAIKSHKKHLSLSTSTWGIPVLTTRCYTNLRTVGLMYIAYIYIIDIHRIFLFENIW